MEQQINADSIIKLYKNILEGTVNRFPRGFWSPEHLAKEKAKLIFTWLIETYLLSNIYDMFPEINEQFFLKHKLRSVIKLFDESYIDAISFFYPEVDLNKSRKDDFFSLIHIDENEEHYLNQIRECYKENDNYISAPIYIKSKRLPSKRWFEKKYGTWENALKLAGIPTADKAKFNKKLKYEDVVEIRKVLNDYTSTKQQKIDKRFRLAKKYGISVGYIYQIVRGEAWKKDIDR